MNLATRCTTCGTIFRVVQDQLRVSEGWVRCGRCAEVFDAREQLFDLERDSPPPWPPVGAGTPAEPAPLARRPAPEPPYQPYQGQFQPSQPAPLPEPMPAPTPAYAPPSYAPSSFQPSSYEPSPPAHAPEPPRAPEPRHEVRQDARDSWLAADDEDLNPFAPPRQVSDEELYADDPIEDVVGARFNATGFDEESLEDRREPFLDAPPAPAPDPRAHLPEPKGMRFEEDELPPPMLDDDRPDVTLALSPATAAQLDAHEPSMEPTTSILAADEDALAESHKAARAAEKAHKPGRSWNLFKRFRREKSSAPNPAETTMTELASESELMAAAALHAPAIEPGMGASVNGASAAAPVPSFMRQAEAARRWQRPGMRIALVGLATVLALGLIAQLTWHGREAIAAQYPVARPALSSLAQAMGQELKPWRHIEALSVESSSLNPAGAGNQYRFSISLRNRSGWDVAQPWVDLTLTDAAGQIVVRRMLSPTEMQAGRPALPAGADQQLQLVFDSGAQKISGYSVELFYP
ncbi:MAG: DUF3426 domain-containing protein [Mitsuaria chitosanitabida]|uniref:zinc-ribbon and DUF3426 domain-containing protein n=1 Tax=Roseateles chitosanitabidus TaxID=65048 RepID=UPI001B0FAB31|nr:DUF3426 domain-containing protein [Roseateles chitosanitabidus]MBO9689228.1 DUF3426 domain-containing protein [Roseateles chitosanitabidus]